MYEGWLKAWQAEYDTMVEFDLQLKEIENSKSVASRTHRRWCRDREPVMNTVGWKPGWEAREAIYPVKFC